MHLPFWSPVLALLTKNVSDQGDILFIMRMRGVTGDRWFAGKGLALDKHSPWNRQSRRLDFVRKGEVGYWNGIGERCHICY